MATVPKSGFGPGVPQIKTVELPKSIQDGEEFIKWDENSGVGAPVTLRIDKNGFYLYWVEQQSKEMEMLDMAIIKDARTGKYAKVPKDLKLREKVEKGMGSMPGESKPSGKDDEKTTSLEDRTITICHGSDFVNLSFINFYTTKKEVAQLWTDEITKLVFSLPLLNSSTMRFLMKSHTKLCLQLDKNDKIPIKNIVKMFAQNKEDRKRVEESLQASCDGVSCGKTDGISPSQFTFERFYQFYKTLVSRSEVQKVYDSFCNSQTKMIGVDEFVSFLNETQRDPRLNEILHPYAKSEDALMLIGQYEEDKNNVRKGCLSLNGFLRYLLSDDNPIIAASKLEINSPSMEHPLAHYFINSSHNTYLTGHQITGKSSVEIYRQCLLAGCRCVELDFWNGPKEEPVIVHGYTFVHDISAKEVIEAIAESAFKTSEYPVVLSFENHCNPRQQAKIAQYCRDIFGDMLLDSPLESHTLHKGESLPPPSLLRRKIIIKNKKQHHKKKHREIGKQQTTEDEEVASVEGAAVADASALDGTTGEGTTPSDGTVQGNGDILHRPPLRGRQPSKESGDGDDDNDDGSSSGEEVEDADGDIPEDNKEETDKEKAAAKETEAGAELSALVNYVQPVHFSSFKKAKEKNRFYEMSSFDEKQAMTLLKDFPKDFVNYNKRQLSRVYPAGTRFDSSNFMPQVFWNAGCQLVALNYQTLDLAMQLNLGLFEYNARCGYLLKPEFMRRGDRELDPFTDGTIDGIIAGTVHIHVLSGQFLSDKRVGTYVEVDMYGLPTDTIRKKYRTRVVPNNGINPVYEKDDKDKPFVFDKIILPELASIRLAAYEESGKFIGHRVLPVVGLCPGFRHVTLRNESGQALPLATLFLEIVVKDYVPNKYSAIVEALANPIKYHSEQDKRTKQLAILTDGMDIDDKESEGTGDGAENGDGPKGVNRLASESGGDDLVCWAGVPDRGSDPVGGTAGLIGLAGVAASSAAAGAAGGASAAASLAVKRSSIAPPGASSGAVPSMSSSPASSSLGPYGPTGGQASGGLSANVDGGSIVRSTSGEIANLQEQLNKSGCTAGALLEEVKNDLTVDTLEKLMDCKAVREKKQEMEKKLEALKKKHEKERMKLLGSRSSQDSERSKPKFYMSNKLVKRLSSKNMHGLFDSSSGSPDLPTQHEGEDVDAEGAQGGAVTGIPRSHSERLITVKLEHFNEERDLQKKYQEALISIITKMIDASKTNQLKLLKGLQERETTEMMKRLQITRRKEVKALSKKGKDREEMDRIKREMANAVVEKGVNERVRLEELYDHKKKELEEQWEKVRESMHEEKKKMEDSLKKDYEDRIAKMKDDQVSSSGDPHDTH